MTSPRDGLVWQAQVTFRPAHTTMRQAVPMAGLSDGSGHATARLGAVAARQAAAVG